MKKLEESDIIRIMREEWDAKVARLAESVDAVMKGKVDGDEKLLMSPGLKLRNKTKKKGNGPAGRGFLYTVVSVSPRDVILQTPEGEEMLVDKDTLEKDYELD